MSEDILSSLFDDEEEKEETTDTEVKETVEKEHNGVTAEELEKAFGPIDDKAFIPMGSAILEDVNFGVNREKDENGKDIVTENKDQITCSFKVPDAFGGMIDAYLNFYSTPNDEEKQNKTDMKIKYCFAGYGIKDFKGLKTFAEHSSDEIKAVVKKLKEKQGEDQLLVPIYQASFIKKDDDDKEFQRFYYTAINRKKKFTGMNYSKYYQEHGGYPTYPDKKAFLECVNNDSESDTMKCQVLSINNNTNFKRFEVEVRPVDVSDEYASYLKEHHIHSFLATYGYAQGFGKEATIDSNKRTRQSQKIASALDVFDYGQVQEKVGELVGVSISQYDGRNGKVYRATLRRL